MIRPANGPTPYYAGEAATLYRADALAVLQSLPDDSVDAVITDPPYSSGGHFRGDRTLTTATKYLRSEAQPDFTGDNRDQRSFGYWCTLWLGEALRVARPGALIAVATDWRQLPTVTDAIQAGGWVWRGIATWAKDNPRPQLGRPAAACEFYVWGTAGPRPIQGEALPGWWFAKAVRGEQRAHQTEKPMAVMRDLVRAAPVGGTVLDPFAGSGTTGVAALIEGRGFVGVELSERYAAVAADRLRTAAMCPLPRDQGDLFASGPA
jgi:site-specific DNA-methyltransferase (adenine-specific)